MRSVRVSKRARAQSMVGLAVALPLFLFALIGAFQLLLDTYAQQVALGAAQDAARLAASRDATVDDGEWNQPHLATDLALQNANEIGVPHRSHRMIFHRALR